MTPCRLAAASPSGLAPAPASRACSASAVLHGLKALPTDLWLPSAAGDLNTRIPIDANANRDQRMAAEACGAGARSVDPGFSRGFNGFNGRAREACDSFGNVSWASSRLGHESVRFAASPSTAARFAGLLGFGRFARPEGRAYRSMAAFGNRIKRMTIGAIAKRDQRDASTCLRSGREICRPRLQPGFNGFNG